MTNHEGIHAVTVFRCAPGQNALFESVMLADYQLLIQQEDFVTGRLIAAADGTYVHVTHWRRAESLARAGEDPGFRNVLSGLPLASPAEPYRGGLVLSASNGAVERINDAQ